MTLPQRPPAPLLGLALAAALAAPAMAGDSRIRELAYDDSAVVRLDGCFGFQTMIEFAPDERIENVGLGDAAQWLVVPNKRANLLFVKPAYKVSHSNMTVATDRRRYSFELSAQASEACKRGKVVYNLRFTYPDEPEPPALPALAAPAADAAPAEAAPPPDERNTAYSFTGARENVPLRVFDNGRQTYFRWVEGTTTPAVFAVAADKTETTVSFTSRGDYLVVDQVAPSFVLRRGSAVAVLYNDAYQTPALDAASPKPRETETADASSGRLPWPFHRRSRNP